MADKQQALVILSPAFPARDADTNYLPAHQAFVRTLCKNYPSLQVVVISFHYPAHTYTWHGATVVGLDGRQRRRFYRLAVWYKAWRTLAKLHRQYTITGLLSFWVNECAVVGQRFAHWHNLKHIAWIRGQDAKPGNPTIKLIRPKSNELIALSNFVARQFYSNYHIQPMAVAPIGIDTAMFSKEEKERTIDILAAGTLKPLKQYDVFMAVLQLICTARPATRAMLCGEGPELERLQALAEQYNITGNVVLAGERPHPELLGLMQQSKVFLHTSNYEGFGAVCAEALYAGAHVISFVKPMDENIEHWYIADTMEIMAAKALALLADPSTQYYPVLPYSMDAVAQQVAGLYGITAVN